ncbi:MAG: hypothetical protein LBU88_02295, partial [Treponema sp.]|nr:hypothetical protein [Treponema sp.]
IYSIHDSLESAKKYINEYMKINSNVEYIIYGKNEDCLYCSNETSELIRQGKMKVMLDGKIIE